VIWIGIAAGVLVAALALAFVFQPRPRDAASAQPPAPATDLPATTAPPAAGTGGNPPGSEPEPSTGGSAPATSGSAPATSSPAPGAGVPADPGWPPSRIPTSLIPHSAIPDPADPAGGVVAARHRVAGFVAALNEDDPDVANKFLCESMVGAFGEDMLTGIEPGSVGVGGVTVNGNSGVAYITFRPTGGGDPEQSEFGLVVEADQWMVCRAP
jgi:hypothetical protein